MANNSIIHATTIIWVLSLSLFSVACFHHGGVASMAAPTNSTSEPHESLASLCNCTTNSILCLSTLGSFPSNRSSAFLQDLMAYVVWTALSEVNSTYEMGRKVQLLQKGAEDDHKSTVQDCLELLDDSMDELRSSAYRLSRLNSSALPETLRGQIMDVRVWLSAAFTDVDTCWDELASGTAHLQAQFIRVGETIEPLLAIALSLAQVLQQDGAAATSYALPHHLSPHY